MSSRELTEWMLLWGIKAEEAELAQQGFSPEEIADAIESGREDDGIEHSALLRSQLGDALQLEQQLRALEYEREANEDESEDDETDDGDG
jgi:hypothetical protein